MIQQVKYIKSLSVKETLLGIPTGKTAKFSYGDMSIQSVRVAVARLNKLGYEYHVSSISGNDYFTVRRDK